MPIVQRDTKHKGVSETVQEIIRELPNDEQYERIGRMLNVRYRVTFVELLSSNYCGNHLLTKISVSELVRRS